MSKHAQLPWKAVKAPKNEGGFYIEEAAQKAVVAQVYECCGWTAEHAEMIVRAVNSHEALVTALKALVDWGRDNTSPRDLFSPHVLLVAAVAALEKAKGS